MQELLREITLKKERPMTIKYIVAALILAAPAAVFAATRDLAKIERSKYTSCILNESANSVTCTGYGLIAEKKVFHDVYRQCGIPSVGTPTTFEEAKEYGRGKTPAGTGERLGEIQDKWDEKCVFWEKKPVKIGTGRAR